MYAAMYAVNIYDLTMMHKMPVALLLGPVTESQRIITVNPKRLDESAVVLECDNKRAEAIIVMLATVLSTKARYPCRVYRQGKRGGWRKLTKAQVKMLETKVKAEV